MDWIYTEARYCPGIRADIPYVVIARQFGADGQLWSEIRAHGTTPEDARASAERGAAQLDSQAHLFPWKRGR